VTRIALTQRPQQPGLPGGIEELAVPAQRLRARPAPKAFEEGREIGRRQPRQHPGEHRQRKPLVARP
jgi:hypothetical protein